MFGIVIFVHIGVFLYKHIHYSYNFLNVTILSVSVRIRLQSCLSNDCTKCENSSRYCGNTEDESVFVYDALSPGN